MAAEIISTTIAAPYLLDTADELYITRNGSVIMSSGANSAIEARAADTAIAIIVDGSVVALSGNLSNPSGIQLVGTSGTVLTNHSVIVGQTGVVQAIYGWGVWLRGASNDVTNNGEISAGASGILIQGNQAQVLNTGLVTGQYGIEIQGDQSEVTNLGRVAAQTIGIRLFGGPVGTLVNSGDVASNYRGISAELSSSTDFDLNISNSGSISGTDAGVYFSRSGLTPSDGSDVVLINSGTIAGGLYGIRQIGQLDLHVTNAALGTITAAGGDAISASGRLYLVNHGSILAAGEDSSAIVLGTTSAFSTITNYGTLSSTFAPAIDASAIVSGGPVFLYNHGSIAGGYAGAATSDVLKNFGTMQSVSTGTGNDNVRNAGLIDGFVLLGAGEDTYRGRLGRVEGFVDGGTENDTLLAGDLDDDLRGGTGDDLIEGRGGDDVLAGALGADTLRGGAGDDTLSAGADLDLMAGGIGADVFVFASALDISNGVLRDRITDFGNGADKIDLSSFMSGADFIGGALFSGSGPEVRYNAANGQLSGDVDGNGIADWTLALTNAPAVSAGMVLL
jgi:Ca2+-binding RTX toxin-like protein